ncbi:MAG: DUF3147 family protein [Candidatus Puniceispirillaceae bacterium]
MVFYLTKLVITAALIVLITEVAKLSDKFGGLIAALPVTTLLVILWMHFEGQPDQKISSHISYNIFFVIPTLPMFLLFPFVISRFGFWGAFIFSVILTGLCVYLFNLMLQHYGHRIL